MSYQHLKQFDQANRFLELAKQHAPNNPEVQRSLAGFYRETGNYSAAIAALKSIRNPNPDVKAELAYTYQLDGKQDEAAKLYAQAANAAPSDLGLQLSAAQAEVAAGSIEHAKPFLQRAAAHRSGKLSVCTPSVGEIARLQEHNDRRDSRIQRRAGSLAAKPSRGTSIRNSAAHESRRTLQKS